MDINSRLNVIKDLDAYLSVKKKLLSDICSNLGWSEESLQVEAKVQCPHNPGHWITESSTSHHVKSCALVKDGYLKEEMEKQPPNSTFFYQKAPSVVSLTIDKDTQAKILIEKGLIEKKPLDEMPDVPKTVDRWTVELNAEQRLAEYDYVTSQAKAINNAGDDTLEDLMFDFEKKNDQEDRPKTQLEILAEQRDYKRRRQSYRAKNVHITKKSYTEVMKEVIENQIAMLAEMRKEENNETEVSSNREERKYESMSSNREERKYERRKRERSLSPREVSPDRQRHDSRDRHHRRSRSRTPKRKKHKHDRSRSSSRSRSRKHKKSHRKLRKSRD